MIIEGKNAIGEALTACRAFEKIYIQNGLSDAQSNELIAKIKDSGAKYRFVDKSVLDKSSPSKRHQGFVGFVNSFEYCEVDDILAHAQKLGQPPFILILDGIQDPHNLGGIIRSAECAGVHGIIIPKDRSAVVNDTVIRVSSGAAEHMKIAKVTNINATIKELKQQNIWVYAADVGGDNIYDAQLSGAIAVVIGGEDTGVRKLTKSLCDGVLSIPMHGVINSLNASVACGIVLFVLRGNEKK